MKKVLILTNNDIGLYKFRKELIDELSQGGYRIYLSLPYGKMADPLIEKGYDFIHTDIRRRGMNPLQDAKLFLKYFRMIREISPDLVITYTIKPNIYGGMAARWLKKEYAVNITGLGTAFQNENWVKKMVTILYRMSCKNAKVVFFENRTNQDIFIENKIVKKENTCQLNGAGVNLREYPFTDYPKDDGSVRFLFIGRVMKEKGVEELFHAFEKVKRQYPWTELDVVGDYEDDYRVLVDSLVKRGIIHYHGYQEDVKPFIANCHCFVLPSYHEGMSNALLEAAAMGRPLITSKIPGCQEAVEDGENGFLAEAKNTERLREVMEQFILISYDKKIQMGAVSHKLIQEKFDKEMVVQETLEALR